MSESPQQYRGATGALAVTSFAIGAAEFIVVGVLPAISASLHITLARAGALIGIYALALALGTPITVLAVARFKRRHVLIALAIVFAVGNLLAALSTSFNTLLVARVVTAISHGSFFAIGATVAAGAAPKGQASRAIALMFAGHTLAMVIGVPLGTYLGNSFGWRLPFFLIAGIASGAVIALGKWLPSTPSQRRTSAWEQLSILANPAILTMMAVTILGFGASFAPFSFIAPLLVNVAGITSADVNLLLVVFGLATLLGNIAGGSAASKIGWQKTLGLMFCALAIVLFGISVFLRHSIVVSLIVFFWGGLAFGMSPACQAGMLSVAERFTPTAVDFASSLNISAFNLGISLGEASGGVMVSNHRLAQTPLLGVFLVLTALIPLQRISYRARTAP